MTHKFCILLIIILCLTSCSGKKDDSVTISVSDDDDSVAMAVDTAHALAEAPVAPPVDKSGLDSLASLETTRAFMENSPHADKYQSGVIPRIMEQSLDYARRLLRSPYDHFIIVDKQTMRVYLFDKYGHEVKNYLMACSRNYGTKHKRRDNRTPEGFFSAQGIYNSKDWLYTNDDGYTSPAKGVYGPRFIRLKTPVTAQVGIHGTNSPRSPGRRVSHGCIRLTNENILDLVKYARTGMPIIVNPSDRDMKVNESEGCDVVQLKLYFTPSETDTEKKDDKKKEDRKETSEVTETKADTAVVESAGTDDVTEKPAEEKEKADTTAVK